MQREQYLLESWKSYPPAQEDWIDVGVFTKSPRANQIVCGRLLAHRDSAIRGHWHFSSGGEEIDICLTEDPSHAAPPLQIFREGDLIAAELSGGPVFEARNVTLLVPSVQPSRFNEQFDVPRSRSWNEFSFKVKRFFARRDFIEATTPTLVPSPGTEPFLDPFVTKWEFGSTTRNYFLPTSPEFHLKKMLAAGWTRIFEFKNCFRNGEIGDHHQPEFTMLEWYRAYTNLDRIADDVADLLLELGAPPLSRTTIRELFAVHFDGFDLTPHTSREALSGLALKNRIAHSKDDSFDDLFFRLFLEKIEPGLGMSEPLLVRGYPPSQAALSRIGSDGFADRFEVYWKGLEIANAFHELNDASENERRFQEDARLKKELGKSPVPVDEELLAALRFGLPPSGGIALGLDRLFMAVHDLKSLSATRAFPVRTREDKQKDDAT